ncbi:MAG: HAMP domain-containing histidine kinase [Acidobacteriota bacterium]|nr:HAMP domain-containing histidine kinase [Acidobacteriota bacterium]
MPKSARSEWLPWVSIGLLFALCAFLAALQYRWTGEIGMAQRTRLQEDLNARLIDSARAFNDTIAFALRALYPPESQVAAAGRNTAWARQYLLWRTTYASLVREAGIEVRNGEGFQFYRFDPSSGQLEEAQRPDDRDPFFVEMAGPPGIPEHLLVLLNPAYLGTTLARDTISAGLRDYDVEIVTAGPRAKLIYSSHGSGAAVWENADGAAPLLDLRFGGPFPRRGPGGPPPFFRGRGPGPGPGMAPGRWRLLARHKAGSLEALVARTQKRNLAVSGAVLLLILGTVAMLIRYSRQAQRLAEMQMNFVAGVSHELRTPLTVIRTAAYNLRSPAFRRNDEQVERYGRMIEAESGKLDALVEQVLSFASVQAGHAVRSREKVDLTELIDAEIADLRAAMASRGVTLDRDIEADLPPVLGDSRALAHAFRNLLDNALKHGAGDANWIGISARSRETGNAQAVEIRVADRGPGIPAAERRRIFEPFIRGSRALSDQIRGTGLGLNLVKTIIEAHSGTVEVANRAGGGAEFIVRIPAAREVAP